MKTLLYLSTILFAFASCSKTSDQGHSNPQELSLLPDGQITIPLDSITPLNSLSVWYFKGTNGKGYLSYAVNKHRYKIFDLARGEEEFEINILKEGPNAITSVRGGLFPIDENQFLIGEGALPNIYRLDKYGKILQKINYEIESKYGRNTDAGTTLYGPKPFIFSEGKLYGADFFFGPWGRWDEDYVFSKKLILEIDTTKGGSGRALPITLPKDLWSDGPRLPLTLYDYANEKFIFSIYGDHNLHTVNKTGEMNSYPAKSKYIESFKDFDLKGNPSDFFKYSVINGTYSNILYDKFRNLYYRFVIHAHNPNENIDWLRGKKHPRKVSIIILDENFIVKGETLLPTNKHNIYNLFITPEGLNISNSHPDNPNLNEDVLSFTTYKVK